MINDVYAQGYHTNPLLQTPPLIQTDAKYNLQSPRPAQARIQLRKAQGLASKTQPPRNPYACRWAIVHELSLIYASAYHPNHHRHPRHLHSSQRP